MQLIHDHIHGWSSELQRVPLHVDRHTLAKRRWRRSAEDGADFGFELRHALAEGDVFHATDTSFYQIAQTPEPVLEVDVAALSPVMVAQIGWMIGNLHFPLQVDSRVLRVADDSALRNLFERESVVYITTEAVFQPIATAHSHEHQH